MATQVTYEWTLEETENGNIVDSNFTEGEAIDFDRSELIGKDLALVRNEGNSVDGVTDRYWAYVVDGVLPQFFSGDNGLTSKAVPKRFFKLLSDYLK